MNQSSCVFEIIDKTLKNSNNRLSVSNLCKIAGVSRSGFYAWVKAKAVRQAQEEKDRRDFELILTAFKRRGYEKGARSIYMELIHQDPPVIMNLKKIRRLMKKFRLYCPIRKANPYKALARALKSSNTAANLVQRHSLISPPFWMPIPSRSWPTWSATRWKWISFWRRSTT